MLLSIIVAVSENDIIGKDNKLIWRLPADLKYFKDLTMGHHVIMGRKTFESIGRPLPGRKFVIITRNRDFSAEGCQVVDSLDKAIASVTGDNEAFIIGGADIYRQCMDRADKIYLTRIHKEFEGDVSFPKIDPGKWREVSRKYFVADEKNPYSYSFIVLERGKAPFILS